MSKYRIAIYLRVSKEDEGREEESTSISMQRLLLENYVRTKYTDYELLEFADDGFTGTNLNRPGLQKMLNMVKELELDCIIVKDLSRFARDYIDVGCYLEQIFPFFGVRFISVNENYDSQEYTGSIPGLDINFKNLLYDLYSKDLSLKVKTALEAKKASGSYVSGNAPFGYEKAADDRHMLVIEEDEAIVVRKIFDLTLEGYSSSQITKMFNDSKVKTPVEFKIMKGKTSKTPKGERFLWSNGGICQILRNPVYVGDIEYGKFTRNVVGGKNRLKPRDEWKIYHNHHEPIISRKEFEMIQEGRGKKRTSQHNVPHVLTGKAVCGCCGRNLSHRRNSRNPYFYCAGRYSNGLQGCVEKVNLMYLEQYLLFYMQERMLNHQEERKRNEERIAVFRERIRNLEQDSSLLRVKIANERKKKLENYENYALGKIKVYHAGDESIKQLERELSEVEENKKALEDKIYKSASNPSALWNDNTYAVLSKEMVDCYIDQIVIIDEQNIKINWKLDRVLDKENAFV